MKRTIAFTICLLFSLVALWLAFRMGDLQLGDVASAFSRTNFFWTIPFMALTILGMYLRAVRWHYLLKPMMRIPTNQLFPPLMIGFALNGLLPFRAGEFARAYALKRSRQCPFSLGFATIILERLFDSILIIAIIHS